jgi:hypothetical protein
MPQRRRARDLFCDFLLRIVFSSPVTVVPGEAVLVGHVKNQRKNPERK